MIPNCSLSFSRHLGYQANPVSSYQAHFVAWYVPKSKTGYGQPWPAWFLDSVNSREEGGGAFRICPISSSVKKFTIKTYPGRRARPYYIDPSKFQPKLPNQSFIFQFSVRKLDFPARSGFREFQVDLIKSLGRSGGRAATATTQEHGLPGQVPSPHAPRSNISSSGVPLTPIRPPEAG